MKPVIKLATFVLLIGITFFAACRKEKIGTSIVTGLTQDIKLSMIPFGKLSISRLYVCAATAGSKILFAGGVTQTGATHIASSRVDIYDTVTKSWSTAELSMPRYALIATTQGNKIFFTDVYNGSSKVDIYDASNNSWSIIELSIARAGIVSASADNKVTFAGGFGPVGNETDIYDAISNNWSSGVLSEPRTHISATSVGNKIYFSGGFNTQSTHISNKVDVYDALTNNWSAIAMSVPRVYHASIGADNKIFWGGGYSSFDSDGELLANLSIETYDVITGNRNSQPLSHCPFSACTLKNKIVFFSAISGLSFPIDVFDINSQAWSEYNIPLPSWTAIGWPQSIIAAGSKIYIVGNNEPGSTYDKQVWKVEF